MDSLFELPETPSPRLKWMRENKCITFHLLPGTDGSLWMADFDRGDYTYTTPADYFCQLCGYDDDSRIGTGETEDEAIIDLCLKSGVKHWSIL